MPSIRPPPAVWRLVAAVTATTCVMLACDGDTPSRSGPARTEAARAARLAKRDRTFASTDVLERACRLPLEQLIRIRRGYYRPRSEDVLIVPQYPNYAGSFDVPNHSGPWRYLQEVPLVLYGPKQIARSGRIETPATLADVYPTMGELMEVNLPPRAGRPLSEALLPHRSVPKLVVTIVWDGVGRNVLRLWPDEWPNLARIERKGTSYVKATVGSSPSITPATHSTLGSGAWPSTHHVTGIRMRRGDALVEAFDETEPSDLERTTFADEIDRALDNAPKVGLVGWSNWHLGMLGHGLAEPGGDADSAAVILLDSRVGTNASYYSLPGYVDGFPTLPGRADALDRRDGEADGRWMGHDILAESRSPAWVQFENDIVKATLAREGYGRDAVPDMLFINYKMSDYAGHWYLINSPEMRDILRAQDRALGELLHFLDNRVGDYVVALTADHGHTLPPTETGGWPVRQGEVRADVDRHFETSEGRTLVLDTTATGLFLDRGLMREMSVSDHDVAQFLNGLTLKDNWTDAPLRRGYRDRGNENLLSAAFPGTMLHDVLECRRDSP
ncbi:MAG: alkaline phosphatase family protein [Actinomycetota bacterium]|nr:alkaline phosphatase family protein [Actinomycetota bacterium]